MLRFNNRTEMAAKSPTASLKRREIIGEEQFSQRREVFDKHDTVFLPKSPTLQTRAMDAEPAMANGSAPGNFQRSSAYSSMRETRRDDIRQENEFRSRKYSDNFTSEINKNDEVDYRHSLTERTRRLSKLRRDFLASNLHDSVSPDPFVRSGTRASLPVRNGSINYKVEIPNIYKFPFAEPYSTPPPIRKIGVGIEPSENNERNLEEKENEDPKNKHEGLLNNGNTSKINHHQLFEELVKRYSPQRKPIDWTLPPTKPKVADAGPKSTSDSVDATTDKKEDKIEDSVTTENEINEKEQMNTDILIKNEDPVKTELVEPSQETKMSLSELEEKNDKVAELELIQRQLSRDSPKRPTIDSKPDPTIPDLLEKMSHDGDERKTKTDKKKIKRKRSFLDKLLGRKKDK